MVSLEQGMTYQLDQHVFAATLRSCTSQLDLGGLIILRNTTPADVLGTILKRSKPWNTSSDMRVLMTQTEDVWCAATVWTGWLLHHDRNLMSVGHALSLVVRSDMGNDIVSTH